MSDKIMDKLFDSKSRARLLKLFFHNPHTAFTAAEIMARTSLSPAETKKTLARLEQMAIVKVFRKSHAKNKPHSRISN